MKKNQISFLLLLFIFSLVPLLDFLHPGLPMTHDGQDHVARIANFYASLSEGNVVPRWAANLNFGYGHPILMFLYPLSSYIASFFHFLGFSLVDSVKLVFVVSYIASGIAMYLWVKEFLGKEPGFVAAILYLFAPYRFVDMYVRGAIGEHVAFVFPPLILYFLLKQTQVKSSFYFLGGCLSVAGLILSHNAISLMFLPLVFLYIGYLAYGLKKQVSFVVLALANIIIGFGLSAFFWLPALVEGKYTLRDIVNKDVYSSRFVEFSDLLYSPWSYGISGQFSVQAGVLHWIGVLGGIVVSILLYRRKNQLWLLASGLVVIFIAMLFLMLPISSFIWKHVSLIQNFQFPWRLLTIAVFATSVLSAIAFSVIVKQYKLHVLVLMVFLVLFLSHSFWQAKGYLNKPESFYTGIYDSTTDTGESAPIWSVRSMEERSGDLIGVIGASAIVQTYERSTTLHSYRVVTNTGAQLRENTVYFPGWKVLVDDKPVQIEFQDPHNRGVMTFRVDKGEHTVSVIFDETRLRYLSNVVSIISFIAMTGYVILRRKRWLQLA